MRIPTMKLRQGWGIIAAAFVVSVAACGAGPMEPMPGDDSMLVPSTTPAVHQYEADTLKVLSGSRISRQ